MTSTRAVTVVVAAAGALLLAGCSGADSGTVRAEHDTTTAAASSSTSSASSASSATSIPAEATAAPTPAAESPTAPAPPTTTAAPAPPVTTVPPPAPLPPAPPAAGGIDSRSPDRIVADSGERGQRYLAALRVAGIPPTGMDAAEVLYAQGTCEALARGDARSSVLAEFDSVGTAYAQFLPMPADRIAEIYVSTAERTYC